MSEIHAPSSVRGRGTRSNATSRFERLSAHRAEEEWPGNGEPPAPLRTELREEMARRIVTKNTSPDISFNRSINPYRGCEHGCVYCFARPSHAFLGLSPGLDFESRLVAKVNAAEVLDQELRAPGYRPEVIAIGTNTDAYQPIERERQVMRGILQVLRDFRHPVAISTKGALVERDVDILGPMSQRGLARVGISLTTLDQTLARRMEPRVPSPARRLRAIETLARSGVEVRVMISPIVPGLTDHEIEGLLRSARDAGAVAASMIALRLPREVATLWRDWLAEHYPNRFNRVMGKIREMHGGQDYDSRFGHRMRGEGVFAELIQARFEKTCHRLGLAKHLAPLRVDLFEPPQKTVEALPLFSRSSGQP